MRREETNEVSASIEWQPTGRSDNNEKKKQWMNEVQDLERLLSNWFGGNDLDFWISVIVAVKIFELRGYIISIL